MGLGWDIIINCIRFSNRNDYLRSIISRDSQISIMGHHHDHGILLYMPSFSTWAMTALGSTITLAKTNILERFLLPFFSLVWVCFFCIWAYCLRELGGVSGASELQVW